MPHSPCKRERSRSRRESRSRSLGRRGSPGEKRLQELLAKLFAWEQKQGAQQAICEAALEEERSARSVMKQLVHDELPTSCGYSTLSNATPVDIALDFKCCVLQARRRNGRDTNQHNVTYSIENHRDMVRDRVRVEAYELAIARVAKHKRVLDVGSGAFCLLGRIALQAGAESVHAVEMSQKAVHHAVDLFNLESAAGCSGTQHDQNCEQHLSNAEEVVEQSMQCLHESIGTFRNHRMRISLPQMMSTASESFSSLRCRVALCQHADQVKTSELQLHCGLSMDVRLPGSYDVVVHEILGHVASSEGVAATIADLVKRRLCSPGCVFVPAAAGTLFAPTSALEMNALEKVLHCYFNGTCNINILQKYHVRCFSARNLLAASQPFEWFEFGDAAEQLLGRQRRRVIFVTVRDGVFDGLHLHLHVRLDDKTTIDTLASETTWSTTYVKLLEDGIWLPCGSRIVCECDAWQEGAKHCYSVSVKVGEPWEEKDVADFSWDGCS